MNPKRRIKVLQGQRPMEILVQEGKVKGVLIVDKAGNVQELRAPVVIFSWAVWYVLDPCLIEFCLN
jgi:hypothetical protein